MKSERQNAAVYSKDRLTRIVHVANGQWQFEGRNHDRDKTWFKRGPRGTKDEVAKNLGPAT